MKIETDRKTILEARRNWEGDLCDNIKLSILESLLEEVYIKGYSDAVQQIGMSIKDDDEEG